MCPTDVLMPSNGHGHTELGNDSFPIIPVSDISSDGDWGEHEAVLSEMRDACKKQGCPTEDISHEALMRFLRARSMKVDKASKMFVQHQNWRASYVPLGHVPDSECSRELACRKVYLQGRSKCGWAVMVALVRNHDPAKRDMEELKRYIVHILDKSIASAAGESGKLIVILDLKGIGYKHLDAQAFIAGFGFLQAYYPERLGKCFMVNVPSVFMGMWKVINRFLDKATKSKVVFVDNARTGQVCLADIDMDVLPTEYGGRAELTLIQGATVPGWPPSKEK